MDLQGKARASQIVEASQTKGLWLLQLPFLDSAIMSFIHIHGHSAPPCQDHRSRQLGKSLSLSSLLSNCSSNGTFRKSLLCSPAPTQTQASYVPAVGLLQETRAGGTCMVWELRWKRPGVFMVQSSTCGVRLEKLPA